jgi:5'-nucleotidase
MMKLTNWATAGCIATAAMAGCQNNASTKPAESAGVRSDVTDIRPMESATPAYQPVAFQPTPAPDTTLAPVTATPAGATAAGNTHVVKRGETLYSIAKTSYGDGKQWQKIASANPGVSPSSLKVGQTLTIP